MMQSVGNRSQIWLKALFGKEGPIDGSLKKCLLLKEIWKLNGLDNGHGAWMVIDPLQSNQESLQVYCMERSGNVWAKKVLNAIEFNDIWIIPVSNHYPVANG